MSLRTKLPPIEYLRECFDHKSQPGELIWKCRPEGHFISYREYSRWNSRYAETKAGSIVESKGFKRVAVKLDGKSYKRTRIIWVLFNDGNDPGENVIDHKDTNTLNDKIDNLRLATSQLNNAYRKMRKDNTSGIKGVSWSKKENKWIAQMQVNGKNKRIGSYKTIEEAKTAYDNASKTAFGEFHFNQ